MVVAYFKILSTFCPSGIEKNHTKFLSRWALASDSNK
jgi:hypothetical protein